MVLEVARRNKPQRRTATFLLLWPLFPVLAFNGQQSGGGFGTVLTGIATPLEHNGKNIEFSFSSGGPDLQRVLAARVYVHGPNEPCSQAYTCGPSSPYSFVIGPESVEDLLEVQSLQELTALIGLDEELMRRRLAEGSTVNLLLFEVDPSLLIPPT